MTTDLPPTHTAEDDTEIAERAPIAAPAPGSHQQAVSPPPVPAAPHLPMLPALPPAAADAARTATAARDERDERHERDELSEQDEQGETGDEAVRTLLSTAATERPVEEVVALVARLQETGELSSPADVALRAAAVTRPLGEVRELVVLLNASGYDLDQAETTLRAAAIGRPIEDVVELVGILGTDGAEWRPTGGGNAVEPKTVAGGGNSAPARTAPDRTDPARPGPKRLRGDAKRARSPLDGALAGGPGSHTTSPALRSALRWPTAAVLFACGLIHLPTDLGSLRSGGDTAALAVVVTVLCLVAGVWLAVRDTLVVWAVAAGLGVAVIVLHGVASARTVDLLDGSLGTAFAWAKAVALLSAVAVVALAGSAVTRHTRTTGAADNA